MDVSYSAVGTHQHLSGYDPRATSFNWKIDYKYENTRRRMEGVELEMKDWEGKAKLFQ